MGFFEELSKFEKESKPFALCTVVNTIGSVPRKMGTKMIVFQDGSLQGTIGGGNLEVKVTQVALSVITTATPQILNFKMDNDMKGNERIVDVFIEPILPNKVLAIIGAGHIGRNVVHLAKWLNFYVILFDERKELCNKEVSPGADEYVTCELAEIGKHLSAEKVNYFVLATKNSDEDIACLPGILEKKIEYVGVIGSRVRWESTKQGLRKEGMKKDEIERIHSPIGLPIGAETPEEIAVSILAEVLAVATAQQKLPEVR